MQATFIKDRDGDGIRADHISICNPLPQDPAAPDSASATVILISGFMRHVRLGDLRKALNIAIERVAK